MSEVNQERKVVRRGISNATAGTTKLKFTEKDAKPQNGLFIAHLDSVTVDEINVGEDKSGLPSFAGLAIPRIRFVFSSNEPEVNRRKYATLQFSAVESNSATIPGGKEEWKIKSVFDWFKHLLNVYVLKDREMTPEEEEALSLDIVDFDENGDYVNVAPEIVLAAWKKLFENFDNILSRGKNGKPYYQTSDGKNIAVWIKLLRYIKHPTKGWKEIDRGNLTFPTFVGEGCVEIFKQNQTPSISLNVIREAIAPMNIEKAKTPAVMPASPVMGGINVGSETMMGGGADMSMGLDEDLPF